VILGLDTATADTAVAVLDGDEVRSEECVGPGEDGRPEHGRALLGLVEGAVTAVGGWDAIELIAAGVGPGSFTGVRIGLSTARALAQARGVPVVGVSTTAALATALSADGGSSSSTLAIGVVDARRGEVFASVDRGDGPSAPIVCPPDQLEKALGGGLGGAVAAGAGAVRFRDEIEAAGIAVRPEADPANHVSAGSVCRLAERVPRRERLAPGGLVPIYMRRPDAERWIDRDHGN
jgi:tRNA threonylcarbamoyladenosine biosynthesis protein TsaB